MKNIIDASSLEDISAAEIYKPFAVPKVYNKLVYCVSCAVHARIVKSRSREDRRIRNTKKPEEK